MKCYNITLLLTLLLSTIVQADTKADFQFCRERTLVIFNLYTKVETNKDTSVLLTDELAKEFPTETNVVKTWYDGKFGDKMDLVKWYQEACMKSKQEMKGKVMA